MTSKRFDPEKDLAPMPFDKRICRQALEMKKTGLEWRPQVGCFVWDPDESIKPASPFPGRIYFILSLARFIDLFDTIEEMAEKLVWLPTWHQARLVCRQLGITDEVFERRRRNSGSTHIEELLEVYGLIIETLEIGDQNPCRH
ncbi:MAG: hypothetical protein AB1Z31_23070 [Desulfobacterales bacterium]